MTQIDAATGCYHGPSVFHVGYIKTGTTFLQNQIFCRADLGMAIAGGAASRAHLIEELLLTDGYSFDPAAAWARLSALETPSRDGGLVPVWSDETLLGDPINRLYNGHAIAERIAALPGPKKVIITIREQRSFALSAYREFIRQGERNEFSDFIGRGDEGRSFTPILWPEFLRYDRAIRFYRDALGAANVLVLPYEMMRAAPDAYIGLLDRFMDVNIAAMPDAGAENKGHSALALRFARRLNSLSVRSPLSQRQGLSRKIAGRLVKLTNRYAPAPLSARIEARMKAEINARYDGLFDASNAETQAMIGQNLAELGYEVSGTSA